MMVSFVFLFLPAAGDRRGTDLMYAGNYGRVHSISARSEMGAFHVWFASNALVPTNSYDLRNLGFAIRLASRLGLSFVMSVVFSLLFLPAAISKWVNYWSVSATWEHYKGRLTLSFNVKPGVAHGAGSETNYIRLASR